MPSVLFASEGREAFGHDELDHLKRLADADPERRSRYCLHQGYDDPVQEMVIVMRHESEVGPHRQRDKRKAYYVLEGALSVEFYDDAARPVERIDMGTPGSGRPFVYRFDADDWHTVIPQTEYVVFVETIEGPFDARRTEWFPGRRNSVRPVA